MEVRRNGDVECTACDARRDVAEVLAVRRRWLSGGLVEELTLSNPHPSPVVVRLELEVAADFAHVFDVKGGVTSRRHGRATRTAAGWHMDSPEPQHP
jgi:hypothetical protein